MTSCRSSEPLKTVHSCRGHVRTVALMLKYSAMDLGLLPLPFFFLYLRIFLSLSLSLSFLYRIFKLSCFGSLGCLIPYNSVGLVANVPFVFGKASPNNEKDAWSFLTTSEGWPCGHWEFSSGATGVDEKSPLRLSHGRSLHDTLLTHVHSLMIFSSVVMMTWCHTMSVFWQKYWILSEK